EFTHSDLLAICAKPPIAALECRNARQTSQSLKSAGIFGANRCLGVPKCPANKPIPEKCRYFWRKSLPWSAEMPGKQANP
ncbi:MAG: hypothetical protein PHS72_04010, partial [Lachnospiraceae bacterium]|nr:hypothetical protein [Lachnospiraceae bacterium]